MYCRFETHKQRDKQNDTSTNKEYLKQLSVFISLEEGNIQFYIKYVCYSYGS